MRTLDFATDKVQQLSLSELEHTYKENLIDGTPVGGVYHFVLIQELLSIFESQGLKPEVQEIFAADNRDSDDVVTNLAVAYHQKGIQVGIGPMVRVCHNQTILGANDVVANYTCFGGSRLERGQRSLEMIYKRAAEWAENYGADQLLRREAMSWMQQEEFSRDDLYRTVGVLTEKRILHDTQHKLIHAADNYPLNSAQINETCEQLLLTFADVERRDGLTFWDAYQHFNTVLKPNRMDIPQVLPQSLALFETMKGLRVHSS